MLASIMMIIGFAGGSTLTATAIEGQVAVTCEGFNGSGQKLFNCRDTVLEQASGDYFLGPIDSTATKVELRAHHENGSNDITTESYDGANGKTFKKVNLWVSSLFQKPLLARGVNRVTYSIYNSKSELAKGEFTVSVVQGEARACAPAAYNSTDLNDCHTQHSMCQRYFQEQNHCR